MECTRAAKRRRVEQDQLTAITAGRDMSIVIFVFPCCFCTGGWCSKDVHRLEYAHQQGDEDDPWANPPVLNENVQQVFARAFKVAIAFPCLLCTGDCMDCETFARCNNKRARSYDITPGGGWPCHARLRGNVTLVRECRRWH